MKIKKSCCNYYTCIIIPGATDDIHVCTQHDQQREISLSKSALDPRPDCKHTCGILMLIRHSSHLNGTHRTNYCCYL